LLLIYSEY